MRDTRVLIVHPEASARALISSMLQSLGPRLEEVASDRAAARLMEQGKVDLLVAGVDPFDPDALELLQYVRRKHPKVPVVLLMTVPHPERAREAQQRGATAVLRFPIPATQLRAAVAQALGQSGAVLQAVGSAPRNGHNGSVAHNGSVEHRKAAKETYGWTVEADHDHSSVPAPPTENSRDQRNEPAVFVGEDGTLRMALELARNIAATRSAVLIQGERGTGKSLLARALHQQGPRSQGPFVELNCGAGSMRESVLEAELFGRRSMGVGSALMDQPGKILQAHGGTLYLDDVEALSPEIQFKLLRLLQEGEFEPVGSTQTLRVDVRLVFGAREDLAERVARGEFRQDLYYRISVVCLKLPPLRHRGADVERLAEHFLQHFAAKYGRDLAGFSPEALTLLRHYEWPGNVQELEATIERAVRGADSSRISVAHLGLTPASAVGLTKSLRNSASSRPGPPGIRPLKEALEEPEKRIILQALEALNWNRQETARLLDINRTTLYKKMKKYGLLLDEPAWAN